MASPPGNEGVWKIPKFQDGDTGAKDTSSSCVTEGPFWQWKDCMCNGVVGVIARSRGGGGWEGRSAKREDDGTMGVGQRE